MVVMEHTLRLEVTLRTTKDAGFAQSKMQEIGAIVRENANANLIILPLDIVEMYEVILESKHEVIRISAPV